MSFPSSDDSWKSGNVVPDKFPLGLRVLVVDDDPTCLRILEMMLKNCRYEVTKCNQAEAALKLLRENKDGFDIVLSDVYMPDMDGFSLLERIGLEMNLPVIMMSADDRHKVVMNGVKHGACDYLIKPVRMEALKNIWQHLVRRKKKEEWVMVEKESDKSVGEEEQYQILKEVLNDSSSGNGEDSGKKRAEEEDDEGEENGNSSSIKKPRVVWSVDLHGKFVRAVNELGIDKAVPKKILEKMDERGLTRENVASHLQKYRIYLRKLSKRQQSDFLSKKSFMHQPGSSSYGSKFLSPAPQMPFTSFSPIRSSTISNNNLQLDQTQNVLSLEKLRSRFNNQPPHQFGGNNVNMLHTSPPLTAQNNSMVVQQQPQPHYRNHILNESGHNQHGALSQGIHGNAAFGQYPTSGPHLARTGAFAEPSGPPARFQDSHSSSSNNFQSLASNSNMIQEQGQQFNAHTDDSFLRDFAVAKFEPSQQVMNSGQQLATVDDDLSKFKAVMDAQQADIGSENAYFDNFSHDELLARFFTPQEAPGLDNYL